MYIMLSNHSIISFFNPPNLIIKPYNVRKCFTTKRNMLFSANNHSINSFSLKKGETNSSFKVCSHQLASEPTAVAVTTAAVDHPDQDMHAGIGILHFFEGKNIFITGATGLLGKVIVEKLLRSTSVGKMYLLIKAEDKEAAFDKLNRQIINSELFISLKEKYGASYEAFVKDKLIPIVGDISKPNLGMDYKSTDAITKDVHIIIHSAASTTFYERYELLVNANVIAPQRVMRFAKTCNKLQLFTHISTAYVNGKSEGMIMEKPLIMGENGVDVADEISLLLKSSASYDDSIFYRNLGQQRAEKLGWNNTYHLSKAMGEMSLNEVKGNVPLLIIRPSIVESCYHAPLPGWIQGMRMCDPVIINYGKGMLPAFYANPQTPMDVVPADLVANTMIVAMTKHGKKHTHDTQEAAVYHVASSHSNPLTMLDMFGYAHDYFQAAPLNESENLSKLKMFENFEEFTKCSRREISKQCRVGEDRKRMRECNAKIKYAEQLAKIYEFATFFKVRFHTGNTEKLIEEMSKEELLNFDIDVKNIDWKKYFQEIHIPGLIKYVLNSPKSIS